MSLRGFYGFVLWEVPILWVEVMGVTLMEQYRTWLWWGRIKSEDSLCTYGTLDLVCLQLVGSSCPWRVSFCGTPIWNEVNIEGHSLSHLGWCNSDVEIKSYIWGEDRNVKKCVQGQFIKWRLWPLYVCAREWERARERKIEKGSGSETVK